MLRDKINLFFDTYSALNADTSDLFILLREKENLKLAANMVVIGKEEQDLLRK